MIDLIEQEIEIKLIYAILKTIAEIKQKKKIKEWGATPIFFIQVPPPGCGAFGMSLPRGSICIKKRVGTERQPTFFPALTRKEFRFVRIFQRISISVRVANLAFRLPL